MKVQPATTALPRLRWSPDTELESGEPLGCRFYVQDDAVRREHADGLVERLEQAERLPRHGFVISRAYARSVNL